MCIILFSTLIWCVNTFVKKWNHFFTRFSQNEKVDFHENDILMIFIQNRPPNMKIEVS